MEADRKTPRQLREAIEQIGDNELKWKLMPSGQFVMNFVKPAYGMTDDELTEVYQSLNHRTFRCWTKKLWLEQEVMPDPDAWNAAYEQTKPLCVVLKRSLLVRLSCGAETDGHAQRELRQQLIHVSSLLNIGDKYV